MGRFRHSVAVVVGIDHYRHGIEPLTNARRDARALAQLLEESYGYEVRLLVDGTTRADIRRAIQDSLPRSEDPGEDRFLFYFAGHGKARMTPRGPSGYLLAEDARPGADWRKSALSMDRLQEEFEALACHHYLILLDCCFAGTFRWSMTREAEIIDETVYQEQYDRFVRYPVWRVMTSAAHDEQASDSIWGPGRRTGDGENSPFARALLDGLSEAGDLMQTGEEGVITAMALFNYVRQQVVEASAYGPEQTPGFWSPPEFEKGEYVFELGGRVPALPVAPPLDQKANPYLGLKAFEEEDVELYFGREKFLSRLLGEVRRRPLTAIVAPSGTGKSSLLRAGLVPRLRQQEGENWVLIGPLRPGERPLDALEAVVEEAGLGAPGITSEATFSQRRSELVEALSGSRQTGEQGRCLVLVDQFEELITACRDEEERQLFEKLLLSILEASSNRVRVVLTLRSDFEMAFRDSPLRSLLQQGRLFLPTMTHSELRRAIQGPASRRVVFFESEALVDDLVEEVFRMPGALPLLSFTLSELYRSYLNSGRSDRTISRASYEGVGGVTGALLHRAEEVFRDLGDQEKAQQTARRILLRMVALEGGEPTRRQVLREELLFPREDENCRVEAVLGRLEEARLIVSGQDSKGRKYLEPAHDKLIGAWNQLRRWISEESSTLALERRLTLVSQEWSEASESASLLWDREPLVGQLIGLKAEVPQHLNQLEHRFADAAIEKHNKGRQNRRRLTVTAIVVLAFAASVFWFQRDQALDLRDLSAAQSLASRAVRVHEDSNQDGIAALVALRALQLNEDSGQPLTAEVNGALRQILQQPFFSYVYQGLPRTIRALTFSEDGEFFASGGEGSSLRIWPLSKRAGTPIDLAEELYVKGAAVADDGRWLVSAGQFLHLWPLGPGPSVGEPRLLDSRHYLLLEDLALNPVDRRFAVVGSDEVIYVWDFEDLDAGPRTVGQPPEGFEMEYSTHNLHLSWSPDGQELYSTRYDGRILVWNLNDEIPVPRVAAHQVSEPRGLAISPDGAWLAATGRQLRMIALEIEESFELRALDPSAEWRAVAFSPAGNWMAASDNDEQIHLWHMEDLAAGKLEPLKVLQGHRRIVYELAFSPGEDFLLSGGPGGELRLWDLRAAEASGVASATFPREIFPITQISLCSDGDRLATARADGTVQLWSLERQKFLSGYFLAHWGEVRGLEFSPDCHTLVSAGNDRQLRLWKVASDTLVSSGKVRDQSCGALKRLAFGVNGEHVAVGCERGLVKLWDIRQPESPRLSFQERAHSEKVPEDLVRGIAMSPDGELLATGAGDGVILLWRLSDLQAAPMLLNHTEAPVPGDRIYALTFSPDGAYLAAGYYGGAIRLWRLDSGQPIILSGHDTLVWSLAFSPDGSRLISGARGGEVYAWNVRRPEDPVIPLGQHSDQVRDVAVDPRGRFVLSGGDDGQLKVWPFGSENLEEMTCAKVRYGISLEEWRHYAGQWAEPFYERLCPQHPLRPWFLSGS